MKTAKRKNFSAFHGISCSRRFSNLKWSLIFFIQCFFSFSTSLCVVRIRSVKIFFFLDFHTREWGEVFFFGGKFNRTPTVLTLRRLIARVENWKTFHFSRYHLSSAAVREDVTTLISGPSCDIVNGVWSDEKSNISGELLKGRKSLSFSREEWKLEENHWIEKKNK